MRLGGEPQPELGVRREARELLGQRWHPAHDQVQVLEAHPVAALGALAHELQRGAGLLPAHRERLEAAGHDARGEVLQFGARVDARGGNHEDGLRRVVSLGGHVLQRAGRRAEVWQPQQVAREGGKRRAKPLGAQRLEQQQELEAADRARHRARRHRLGRGRAHPLRPLGVAREPALLHELRQRGREQGHVRLAVGRYPAGHGEGAGHAARLLACEETPVRLGELVRRERAREVQREGEPVLLDERARHRLVRALLQVDGQTLDPLLRAAAAAADGRGERGLEEAQEAGQRELVHVAEPAQVDEREEDGRADHGHRAVHVALAVERDLQLRRLLELLRDGVRLGLGLVERLEQRLVLEDVARRGGQLVEQQPLEVLEVHLELLLGGEQRALLRLELRLLVLDG
mmetsp:Transcript_24194/g.61287  ORF Transcript_24194/g.61287 Transcript_24194/m.61287 type:complete len:403 (-) Transcript_24194:866-2074(-)